MYKGTFGSTLRIENSSEWQKCFRAVLKSAKKLETDDGEVRFCCCSSNFRSNNTEYTDTYMLTYKTLFISTLSTGKSQNLDKFIGCTFKKVPPHSHQRNRVQRKSRLVIDDALRTDSGCGQVVKVYQG